MAETVQPVITLEDLQEFKTRLDAKTTKRLKNFKDELVGTVWAISFDTSNNIPVFDSDAIQEVLETRPNQLRIGIIGYSDFMYAYPSWTWDDDDTNHDHCDYIQMDQDGNTLYVRYFMFRHENGSYVCTTSCTEFVAGSTGATHLYKHYLGYVNIPNTHYDFYFYVISNSSTPITSISELQTQMKSLNNFSAIHVINTQGQTHEVAHMWVDLDMIRFILPDNTQLDFSSWTFGNDIVTAI